MKLTESTVSTLSLAAGEDDRIFFDDQIVGFGYRIRRIRKWNTGAISNKPPSRSWLFQYRIGGKTRRLVIGQASAIKAARARQIAGELHAKVKLGGNPAVEKRIPVVQSSRTLGSLVEQYLAHRRGIRSYRHIALRLTTHCAPLHTLPVDAIDRQAIASRLNAIEQSSGAVTANRTRSTLSAMFGWAMREGLALTNPVVMTNKRVEKPRDRVLSDDELALIWRTLGDDQYSTIVKLLILTGQRWSEIAALRWSEIDLKRGVISLPAARVKNDRPHEIPMANTTRALLAAQPKNGRDLVFGEGAGPFAGQSHRKVVLDQDIAKLNGEPLPPWVHHDLRRSVATGMAELGIQPHIIEAVLNHASGHKGGIAGIYNRAQYGAEKAQALARWDEHVASIIGGR